MLEDSVGSTAILVVVFLLIIAGAYFSTKFLSVKSAGFMKGKYMQVKERLPLGRDKHVLLVQAGNRYFVVGVTAQSMQLLGTVEEGELTPIVLAEQDKQVLPPFRDWLTKAKRQQGTDGSSE